jgi:helicase required for RNAi-mediated heterochromatin assembly 1
MQNVNILENWPSAPEENLDKTQWAAMEQILTKRLAIIQGPPGTGKTYVSKMALQVLIENKKEGDPPIIVAAQTNHALDQLLGHVSMFDPEYIRLGGQSNKPEVRKRALYEVRHRERLPMPPGGLLGKANKQKDNLACQMTDTLLPLARGQTGGPFTASILHELGVLSQDQANSLKAGAANWVTTEHSEPENEVSLWLGKALIPFLVVYTQDSFGFSEEEVDLEYEQVAELQAEMGVTDDEDIENLQGAWCTVEDNYTVAKPSRLTLRTAEETLARTTDLWRIKENLRGPIYSLLQARAKANILAKFREQAKTYEILTRDLRLGKWERDAQYLERANIIGMTTTGLSKYRPLISSLKPKIILIEEAAEVIEAPVTAACVESLEHLILIGDHQQLQGHCNVEELGAEPYNLNVSMFERLVHNHIPFKTLLRQRRMDPEFRRLLHPIYPQLQDHQDVVGRPPLPVGLGTLKSFFFTHEYPEYKDGQFSTFNDREAEFIAGFYHYLLQNSANPSGITILTFYNGQRKRILSHLKSRPLIAYHYAKVVTVDSYQGEENGIIILSLVRNNEHGEIGFLKVDNRVCVALSRAQHGFYIFGNGKLLTASSPLWSKVIGIMAEEPNRIGNKFPIVCKKHGRQTFITYPGDWLSCDGGCDVKCSESLPCGHLCSLRCHSYPHDTMNCQQKCGKVLLCGHTCAKSCFETPCFCSCDQFGKSSRTSQDGPPDAAQPSEDQQVAPRSGGTKDSGTNAPSVGNQGGRPTNRGEARGNNKESNTGMLPPSSKSCSLIPQNSQSVLYGHVFGQTPPVALAGIDSPTLVDLSTALQSLDTSDYSSWTPSTSSDIAFGSGKISQSSPEKTSQMVAQWTEFAAEGVKKDDSKREMLAAAEADLIMQQRLAQAPLIDLEDTSGIDEKDYSSTQGETAVEMKNGRKKWSHDYRPSYDATFSVGYTTTPSMRNSESGQSSDRQIPMHLLD